MRKLTSVVGVSLVLVLPSMAHSACVDENPYVSVTSSGGGQSATTNETLVATFSGHIMTTNGLSNRGRNVVKVCPGTSVEYLVSSTVGAPSGPFGFEPRPDCGGKPHYGILTIGDKLSCNNKNLGGRDTDTFTVKAGR